MRKTAIILAISMIGILASCSVFNPSAPTTTAEPTTTTGASSTVAATTEAEMTAATTQAPTETTQAATAATTAATTIAATTAATPTPAPSTTGSAAGIQVLTGTFQGLEWGDYLHITIKSEDGVDYTFFVLKYPGVDPETLAIGQKVKVTWQNSDEFLDPPGETVNVDKVISIELVD